MFTIQKYLNYMIVLLLVSNALNKNSRGATEKEKVWRNLITEQKECNNFLAAQKLGV